MTVRDGRLWTVLLAALIGGGMLFGQGSSVIPHLKKQGTAVQLVVDGSPFIILGGELGNSNASDLPSMEWIWPKLDSIGLNTVLVPVYWDLIEPKEGDFDYTLIDGVLAKARAHRMRLVLLWFGSWKNSMSCYAPAWIKTDQDRFPRAGNKAGTSMEILSAFGAESRSADIRAFSSLMSHLRDVDSDSRTVIMVQVENEIGMIPDARDYSTTANKKFSGPVPEALTTYLAKNRAVLAPELDALWKKNGSKTKGTWSEVFGDGPEAEEIFTAWYYAIYTEAVASAGKSAYPLPMFVNAALIRPGYAPGRYPSGGPLPHLIDIWRAGAPSIDFLAPDIYFPAFSEWCGKYRRSGNPLFIPETILDPTTPVNALFAFGEYDAIGISPFSIEYLDDPAHSRLAKSYELLRQMTPLITGLQGRESTRGVLLDEEHQKVTIELGKYVFHIAHDYTFSWTKHPEGSWPRVGAMIVSDPESPDRFYIAGSGVIVTFDVKSEGAIAGIISVDEGKFISGRWVPARRLDGDQTHQGRHLRIPYDEIAIQKVHLYKYH